MKKFLFFSLFSIVFFCRSVQAETYLHGNFIQGGMAEGTVPYGSHITLEEENIPQFPGGRFLLGFHRDANPALSLSIRFPDGLTKTQKLDIAQRKYNIQRIDGLPASKVTPPRSKALQQRITIQNNAIKAARSHYTQTPYLDSGFMWPVIGRISGVYGSQRILNGQPRQPHYGIDIAAPLGTTVVAPAAGIVRLTQADNYFAGNTLVLDHGGGLTSSFLHLQNFLVTPGQIVTKGKPIATLGSTGRSTGPHLDWRMNLGKARIDPQLLVPEMPAIK